MSNGNNGAHRTSETMAKTAVVLLAKLYAGEVGLKGGFSEGGFAARGKTQRTEVY
jgi:hypothetical protein